MSEHELDDLLDRLVAEFSDALTRGADVRRDDFLARVPAQARPGLERCLKVLEAGLAQVPSAREPLGPGSRLGRYRLVRELGRGGMAHVWLAQDPELARPVALKVLRPGLALEPQHVDRFRREALAVARLAHAHVVLVHDVGAERGWHFLAMEYVEGPALAQVIAALGGARRASSEELARATGVAALARKGRSFEAAVAELLAPVADALHAAHELGLVHRDVKPSNILLRRDGRAVVADFGLAKAAGDPALSLTGDTLGTPYYMAPEQAWLSATRVDARSDVYSLGVTLYETLGGVRPFQGESVLQVFEAIKTRVPPGLRSHVRHLTKDAEAVVRRAMQRAPEERYASAAELAADLRALAAGEPTLARRAEGSRAKRLLFGVAQVARGARFEYRSAHTLLGLALVHVIVGRRAAGERLRAAKGWFALGDLAIGPVAVGNVALGGLSFGGLALGAFSLAGLALGGFACGGGAVGGIAVGGAAAGGFAFGGAAVGYAAVGGYARGHYALGGKAVGEHVIDGLRADREALRWFEDHAPYALSLLPEERRRGL
jgi:hypothetical protein